MQQPKNAFVLAAGKGTRMRPLTNNCPKPLLEVAGRSMLDRNLDALVAAGVEKCVVNVSYLADMVIDHLQDEKRMEIIISREEELLETGGGVKKEIHHFGDDPFYVMNSDVFWTDAQTPALDHMAQVWNSDKMDMLLMLYPISKLPASTPSDYKYYEDGQIKLNRTDGAHAFMGPRIVHPRIFDAFEPGFFSFLDVFNHAEANDRLYGMVHDGDWYHCGTPEDLAAADAKLTGK